MSRCASRFWTGAHREGSNESLPRAVQGVAGGNALTQLGGGGGEGDGAGVTISPRLG
jgi:hypothetical protein